MLTRIREYLPSHISFVSSRVPKTIRDYVRNWEVARELSAKDRCLAKPMARARKADVNKRHPTASLPLFFSSPTQLQLKIHTTVCKHTYKVFPYIIKIINHKK